MSYTLSNCGATDGAEWRRLRSADGSSTATEPPAESGDGAGAGAGGPPKLELGPPAAPGEVGSLWRASRPTDERRAAQVCRYASWCCWFWWRGTIPN